MKKILLHSIFITLLCLLSTQNNLANAGLIDTNSTLLNEANANQLEQWLGQGDLDWQSIWYGAGNARSHAWHAAVDTAGPTVSIYSITHDGIDYLVGGYTNLSWNKKSGKNKKGTGESFIFNLSEAKTWDVNAGEVEIVADPYAFATFGTGHDLMGGFTGIGISKGKAEQGSYNYSGFFDAAAGHGGRYNYFFINSLETFTFSAAVQVSEPATWAIFSLSMLGLAIRRYKSKT